MTEQNPNPNQEEQSNPDEGGQEAVSVEDFKNLQKGVQKLAESLNSLKKPESSKPSQGEESTEDKPKSQTSAVLKSLYFKSNPEVETVWDDVEEEARSLNVDPFEHYESKKGWQLEAKARAEAERKKQEAKESTEEPSGKTGENKFDYSKIKPEEIRKLNPTQRQEYRDYLTRQADEPPMKRVR